MGTCFIISYCFTNYVYVCGIVTGAIFLPTTIVIGVSYTKIIIKLREVRRNLEKHDFNKKLSRLSNCGGGIKLTVDPSTTGERESNEQSVDSNDNKGTSTTNNRVHVSISISSFT